MQWTYNTCSFVMSIFYLVVSGFALFSLTGSKYGMEAEKPLNMTSEFTLQVRDWAVKPYVDIKVQSLPCDTPNNETPYEPLFNRLWGGTEISEFAWDCN